MRTHVDKQRSCNYTLRVQVQHQRDNMPDDIRQLRTFRLNRMDLQLQVPQQFTVNMKEAKRLSTLEKAIAVFGPVMMDFQEKHNAYKFQIVVSIVVHKTVDPAVGTQPPLTLTSERVAVYARSAS